MNLPSKKPDGPAGRAPGEHTPSTSNACGKCELGGCRLGQTIRLANLSGTFPVRRRRYPSGTTIYEAGEMPGLVGVLKSGYLREERTYDNGRRTIFGLRRPGEIIGKMAGQSSETTVTAATDIEVCRFEESAATRLVNGSERFRKDLLFQATVLRDLQFELVWQRGALNSRERVIAFLVTMAGFMPAERLPDGSVIVNIELSRRDWADMSNTSMETISRTMTKLSSMGLVESTERHRYRISDLGALADMAGMKAPVDLTLTPHFPS